MARGAKYVDISAIVQVIGGIYLKPSLLDAKDKYFFNEEDFTQDFHKILFGSIYNLYTLGAKEITPATIEDYLSKKPKSLAVYKNYKGTEFLLSLQDNVQLMKYYCKT